MRNQRTIINFFAVILVIFSFKESEAKCYESLEFYNNETTIGSISSPFAFLIPFIPSYYSLKYYDDNSSRYVTRNYINSGWYVNLMFLNENQNLIFGLDGSIFFQEYGFSPPLNGSLNFQFGVGAPFNGNDNDIDIYNIPQGFYIGASGGGSFWNHTKFDYFCAGVSYGIWGYIGNNRIGLLLSFDKIKESGDPNIFKIKLMFGGELPISIVYTKFLATDINEVNFSLNMLSLGLSYSGI